MKSLNKRVNGIHPIGLEDKWELSTPSDEKVQLGWTTLKTIRTLLKLLILRNPKYLHVSSVNAKKAKYRMEANDTILNLQ